MSKHEVSITDPVTDLDHIYSDCGSLFTQEGYGDYLYPVQVSCIVVGKQIVSVKKWKFAFVKMQFAIQLDIDGVTITM